MHGANPGRIARCRPAQAPSVIRPGSGDVIQGCFQGLPPAAVVQRHGKQAPSLPPGMTALPRGVSLPASGGMPLPAALRHGMETFFRADFSDVRIHVGREAPAINALAVTSGSRIFFGPGRYRPDTVQGLQLLGHELAHVVQQRQGRVRNPLGSGTVIVRNASLELEADRLGRQAAAQMAAPGGATVQRKATPTAPVRRDVPRPDAVVQAMGAHFTSKPLVEKESDEEDLLLQQEITKTITMLKSREKYRKQNEEILKNNQMMLSHQREQDEIRMFSIITGKKPNPEQVAHITKRHTKWRSNYLFKFYVPILENIGITSQKIEEYLPSKVRQHLKFERKRGGDLTVVRTTKGRKIYMFAEGDMAFTPLFDAPLPGDKRKLYVKRWSGSDKTYVRDDRNVFTRRFAYAWKGAGAVDILNTTGFLHGRWRESNPDDDIRLKGNYPTLQWDFPQSGNSSRMSIQELLQYNQEMGSSPTTQRALPFSSTSKLLHGNRGETFKSSTSRQLIVDLAKVPIGKHLFYNLYDRSALRHAVTGMLKYPVRHSRNGPVRGSRSSDAFDAEKQMEHFRKSVLKNRELFLQYLDKRWVVSSL